MIQIQSIKKITQQIAKQFDPEKIILFGSHAWGIPTKDSDVDLCILKNTDNTRHLAEMIDGSLFPRPFPIDVIVYTKEQMQRRQRLGDHFIAKILTDGKLLYDKHSESAAHGMVRKS